MGPVKDQYLHYESAGDQFVGGIVAVLYCLGTESAVSPCYFNFTESENPDESKKAIDAHINSTVIGGRRMGPKLRYLTTFLLATICYHYDF